MMSEQEQEQVKVITDLLEAYINNNNTLEQAQTQVKGQFTAVTADTIYW